jgi:hypothetical protein
VKGGAGAEAAYGEISRQSLNLLLELLRFLSQRLDLILKVRYSSTPVRNHKERIEESEERGEGAERGTFVIGIVDAGFHDSLLLDLQATDLLRLCLDGSSQAALLL